MFDFFPTLFMRNAQGYLMHRCTLLCLGSVFIFLVEEKKKGYRLNVN